MFTKSLSIFLILFPIAVCAQGLSTQDCADIRETYGIAPPQCDKVADQNKLHMATASVAPEFGVLTPSQRENNVFFPAGGAILDTEALVQVDQLASVLGSMILSEACIKLIGHSDRSGGVNTNLRISLARANAVKSALATRMANPARIEHVEGLGEGGLLANIQPQSVWQRRVEIRARKCS